jgi:hypothetical protein
MTRNSLAEAPLQKKAHQSRGWGESVWGWDSWGRNARRVWHISPSTCATG